MGRGDTDHLERRILELKLEASRLRERTMEAELSAQTWRRNYDGAIAFLAIYAPPDHTELIHDASVQRYLRETA